MEGAPYVIIHLLSLAGFFTNTEALVTIYRSPRLQSSFGILCAVSATGNIVLLTMNSTWYAMPSDDPVFAFKSPLSRYIGIVGVTIWTLGLRLHLLIALNRMVALVFPLASSKYASKRMTLILLAFGLLIAVIQAAPLIIMDDAWFCYEPKLMMWIFAPTEWGMIYERYFNYYPTKIEFVSTVAMDLTTLAHLKLRRKVAGISQQKSRKLEVNLFFQSFSQILPFLFCFITFAYITPHLESNFGRFLSTTGVWHAVHFADGLIIDIFHTKSEFFSRSKKNLSTGVKTATTIKPGSAISKHSLASLSNIKVAILRIAGVENTTIAEAAGQDMWQLSIAGFLTNTVALVTIYRSPRLQSSYRNIQMLSGDATVFGILCAVSATGNIIVLTMNSTWYSMPSDVPIFAFKSPLSRYVGIVGVTIWTLSLRLHLLIAFNRMVALVFPLASYKYASKRMTLVLLGIGLLIAVIQAAPLIILEDAWFCYESKLMMWIFAPTKWGVIYERYFNYYPTKVEFISMDLTMDLTTLAHLKFWRKVSGMSRTVEKARGQPLLSGRFLSTTGVWHAVHFVDGLIIDIFHTKTEYFTRRSKKNNSISVKTLMPTIKP